MGCGCCSQYCPGDYSGVVAILFLLLILFVITILGQPTQHTYTTYDNSCIKTQYVGISTNGDG
uniref:p7B n=1 Tax=Melon necrotic spot virus TaxID=11987 RepID=L7RH17_MNSV|nr:p7B [Cucurbit carmovirus]